jgi:hypothetical protein
MDGCMDYTRLTNSTKPGTPQQATLTPPSRHRHHPAHYTTHRLLQLQKRGVVSIATTRSATIAVVCVGAGVQPRMHMFGYHIPQVWRDALQGCLTNRLQHVLALRVYQAVRTCGHDLNRTVHISCISCYLLAAQLAVRFPVPLTNAR